MGVYMSGKKMHSKKKKAEQVKYEGYPTPKSLVWELVEQKGELLASDDILESCCGQDLSIVKALSEISIVPKSPSKYILIW